MVGSFLITLQCQVEFKILSPVSNFLGGVGVEMGIKAATSSSYTQKPEAYVKLAHYIHSCLLSFSSSKFSAYLPNILMKF